MTEEPDGIPSDFSARLMIWIPADTIERMERDRKGRSSYYIAHRLSGKHALV